MVYVRKMNEENRLKFLLNKYNYYKDEVLYKNLSEARSINEFYEILQKYCYEVSASVGFIKIDVEKTCIKLGMSYDMFFNYAKSYALKNVGISNEEWLEMINEASNFSKAKRKFERLLGDLYYTDKDLYDELNQIRKFDEFNFKFGKYCYDLCSSVDFLKVEAEKKSISFGKNYSDYLKYAKNYALEYLKMTDQQWSFMVNSAAKISTQKKNFEKNRLKLIEIIDKSSNTKLYDQLINADTMDDFYEKLGKYCYDLCFSVGFVKYDFLRNLHNLNYSYDIYLKYAKKYALEYLKMPNEEWKLLISNGSKVSREKEKFGKLLDILYINNRDLYDELNSIRNIDEFYLKFGKYCYEVCYLSVFVKFDVEKKCEEIGLSYDLCLKYAKKYALEYLGISDDKWRELINSAVVVSRSKRDFAKLKKETFLYDFLMDLLSVDSNDDILDVIKKYRLSLEQIDIIKRRVVKFCLVFPENLRDNLEEKLNEKLNVGFKLLEHDQIVIDNMNNFDNNLFESAKMLIGLFVDDNTGDKVSFCVKNKITEGYFEILVEILKEFDPVLYTKYQDLVGFNCIKKVIELIDTGVKLGNNTVREFDLLDYLLLVKISNADVFRIIKNNGLSKVECSKLYHFLNKNRELGLTGTSAIKHIYNEIRIVSDREITLEEKKSIINYLNCNHVPISLKVYNIVLRRYLSGELKLKVNNENLLEKYTSFSKKYVMK